MKSKINVPIYVPSIDGNEYSTSINNVEPADKLNIRRYIKGICSADQCADTFFLYLSSPAKKDGNSLLWDANGNGIVSYYHIGHPTMVALWVDPGRPWPILNLVSKLYPNDIPDHITHPYVLAFQKKPGTPPLDGHDEHKIRSNFSC